MSTQLTSTLAAKPPPVLELRAYLRGLTQRCRTARWLGALFHVRVCEDIAADVETMRASAHAKAVDAERFDDQADEILVDVLRDGLDHTDIPKLRRAIACIRRSRKSDAEIAELLKA